MSGYCDICGNTLCVCGPGSEVEALRTEVARLRDERDELRAQIADAGPDRAFGANVRRLVEAHGGIEAVVTRMETLGALSYGCAKVTVTTRAAAVGVVTYRARVRGWDWREADTLDEAVAFLVAELEGE